MTVLTRISINDVVLAKNGIYINPDSTVFVVTFYMYDVVIVSCKVINPYGTE